MEKFSNQFLKLNRDALSEYSARWAEDPLHNWSRQWEYPFVYSRIEEFCCAADAEIKILDAGSGVTFFPYYISAAVDNVTVDCCDTNPSWGSAFTLINDKLNLGVGFHCAEIQKLPLRNNSRDVIYCISVLEHTADQEKAIKEFHRVLRDSGLLLLTFDVSIDSLTELRLEASRELVNLVTRYFCIDDLDVEQLIELLQSRKRLLRDTSLLKTDLPASVSGNVVRVLSGKSLSKGRNNLTVCCLAAKDD